jgi:hypothetical protein
VDTERWLAPLVGAIAISTALVVVGVYAWGLSVPERHLVTVSAVVPRDAEAAFAVVADPAERPRWAPQVARIGRVDDDPGGRRVWRELDETGDRFEFSIVSDAFPTVVLTATRPEEIGMTATWTWTVSPADGGARVTLTEDATIRNPLFRGVWALRTGPWAQVEGDLSALARHLGGTGAVTRE